MRLTCPNCGAQYEVPDEVIPQEGRDVQCSNCGTTWFQPAAGAEEAPMADAEAPPAEEPVNDPAPEPEESAAPEPEEYEATEPDEGEAPAADNDETLEEEPGEETQETPVQPVARGLDPSVADILKEEAARERELRKSEQGNLESQPDLGLDTMTPEPPRPEQSDTRIEQAVSATVAASAASTTAPAPEEATRRELLPDIEEINSTLRSSEAREELHSAQSALYEDETTGRGSFMRGFLLAVGIVVVLLLIYANAPAIARSIPQSDPLLSAFVGLVDQGRLWLDAQIGALVSQ